LITWRVRDVGSPARAPTAAWGRSVNRPLFWGSLGVCTADISLASARAIVRSVVDGTLVSARVIAAALARRAARADVARAVASAAQVVLVRVVSPVPGALVLGDAGRTVRDAVGDTGGVAQLSGAGATAADDSVE